MDPSADTTLAVLDAMRAAVREAFTQGAGDAAAATLKSVTVTFADDGGADVILDGAPYTVSADRIAALLDGARDSMPPPSTES